MKKTAALSLLILALHSASIIPNSKAYTYYLSYKDGEINKIETKENPERIKGYLNGFVDKHIEMLGNSNFIKINLHENDLNLENKLEVSKLRIDENDMNAALRETMIKKFSNCTKKYDDSSIKVAIAVAAWESRWGTSNLAVKYNNYFGIKANDEKKVSLWTYEYENKRKIRKKQDFGVYDSIGSSINQFMNLKIVKKSYDKNPYVMAKNLYKRGYCGGNNPEWINGVTKVLKSLN
jgi:uncharacterized FlgJ-related protein